MHRSDTALRGLWRVTQTQPQNSNLIESPVSSRLFQSGRWRKGVGGMRDSIHENRNCKRFTLFNSSILLLFRTIHFTSYGEGIGRKIYLGQNFSLQWWKNKLHCSRQVSPQSWFTFTMD